MKRKIYDILLDWKNDTNNIKPLMILGARQVGKTYIIDDFCKHEYSNYVYVNLLDRLDIVDLYETRLNSLQKLTRLKALLNVDLEQEDTILFIDEIQESEKLISELKYFCEKHNKMRIVVAGSLLGVKLKRSRFSFPVGKVKMVTMYPMDFEEFLWAMNQYMLIDEIKNCYLNNTYMVNALHEKALDYYKYYLISGGMPESVQNMVLVDGDVIKYQKNIKLDIIDSYFKDMDKYVENNSEALKIEKTYRSIPAQLSNESNKFQFSKIDSGARFREYESSLNWLEASNMVVKNYRVSIPEIPLEGFIKEEFFKLFLNDVGLLTGLLDIKYADIMLDNLSLYKGAIVENFVANQLICNGFSLYYWQSDGIAKVDFLLYTKDGVIPLEVKAGDSVQSKSLKVYMDKFNPKYAIRINTRNFGYDKEKRIKSIPLYAIFCLKNEE